MSVLFYNVLFDVCCHDAWHCLVIIENIFSFRSTINQYKHTQISETYFPINGSQLIINDDKQDESRCTWNATIEHHTFGFVLCDRMF